MAILLDDARSLYERATSLKSQRDEAEFIAPKTSIMKSAWLQVRRNNGALKLVCDGDEDLGDAVRLRQVTFISDDPAASRLAITNDKPSAATPPRRHRLTPGTIIIATPTECERYRIPRQTSELALLVDVQRTRARLATPRLMHSTFSRLMYLDGRDAQFFGKVHEETGFAGERVALWKINWQRLEAFDQDG